MAAEVLVIGGNHQNPLGIIESLGRKGLRPYVIIYTERKSSFVLKSKYIRRGWICNTETDLFHCILDNFSHLSERTVTIACNDDMASFLGQHYSELKDFLYLPVIPGNGMIRRWMDKEFQSVIARRVGLTIPAEWKIKGDDIPSGITYPCITKSMTSVDNGKSEFSICRNLSDLQSFFCTQAHNEYVLAQKYIDKEFEYQLLGLSLNGGEKIIIPGRTHIEHACHFNNLVFLKYQEDTTDIGPSILHKVRAFIKQSGYSGLFSAEFMHGKDGTDYFLEVNFRNDGNGIAATASGTNLPYLWYLYCTGGDYISELGKSEVKDTYLMPEDSYFITMLSGDISFKEWCRDLKKTSCFLTYFKEDRAPFLALLWLQKRSLAVAVAKMILRKLKIGYK